jgi:hypothetical protein
MLLLQATVMFDAAEEGQVLDIVHTENLGHLWLHTENVMVVLVAY